MALSGICLQLAQRRALQRQVLRAFAATLRLAATMMHTMLTFLAMESDAEAVRYSQGASL